MSPGVERARVMGRIEADVKRYKMGHCAILVGSSSSAGWHLSVSHPKRYPTWDEVVKARYELLPEDVTMALYLPPLSEYVNVHETCFHLFEVKEKRGMRDG